MAPNAMPNADADASRYLRVRVPVARVLDGRARAHSRAFTRDSRPSSSSSSSASSSSSSRFETTARVGTS